MPADRRRQLRPQPRRPAPGERHRGTIVWRRLDRFARLLRGQPGARLQRSHRAPRARPEGGLSMIEQVTAAATSGMTAAATPVATERAAFLFTGARRDRLEQGEFPSEFFYGALELQRSGYPIEFLEEA